MFSNSVKPNYLQETKAAPSVRFQKSGISKTYQKISSPLNPAKSLLSAVYTSCLV